MQTQLEIAEALLKDIKTTGSHHQIKEKIDAYFQNKQKSIEDYNQKIRGQQK